METLYERCAGLDVHKDTVVACVRIATGRSAQRGVKTFATRAARVKEVGAGDWLSFWKATPQKVGSLIRGVVGSAPFCLRASDMAKAMVEEDGTGVATNRLERLVAG
jgi:hypothetical protein